MKNIENQQKSVFCRILGPIEYGSLNRRVRSVMRCWCFLIPHLPSWAPDDGRLFERGLLVSPKRDIHRKIIRKSQEKLPKQWWPFLGKFWGKCIWMILLIALFIYLLFPPQIGIIKSRLHYLRGPKLSIPWFLDFWTYY